VSFGSGNDWVEGGLAAGRKSKQDYVTNNYHQPSDEWSADWSFAGMAHDLGLLYAVGRDLADSRDWPNWAKDAEFRAARDASAAQRK
jgi:Zn-dependent M28 family amino/carboxypeptidase